MPLTAAAALPASPAALASRGLGYEHALLSGLDGRRMVLYELEVLEFRALHEKAPRGVSVALRGAGSLAEEGVLPSCCHDHRISIDRLESPHGFVI